MEIYFTGIIIAFSTFLIIGLFHPVVIKTEYYTGTRYWWTFLISGLACIGSAIFVENVIVSSLLGVLGATLLWSPQGGNAPFSKACPPSCPALSSWAPPLHVPDPVPQPWKMMLLPDSPSRLAGTPLPPGLQGWAPLLLGVYLLLVSFPNSWTAAAAAKSFSHVQLWVTP